MKARVTARAIRQFKAALAFGSIGAYLAYLAVHAAMH